MNPYSNDNGTGSFAPFSKQQKISQVPLRSNTNIRQEYMARHKNSVPLSNVKHDCFKNSFPSLTVIEWSKIDSSIRNSENLEMHIGFHKTFRKYYFSMLQS